nr:hypothetical protein [Nonomuraea pusilla]
MANHSSVRRSSHSAYDTCLRDASAHIPTLRIHDGAYDGRFFCMNGSWPGRTRTTDSGRPRSAGRILSRTASR